MRPTANTLQIFTMQIGRPLSWPMRMNVPSESTRRMRNIHSHEELKKYDAEVSLEDCNEMTMHELHEEIDRHHNGSHDGENELHDSAEESHIPETEHTSSAGQHSETKEETTHHGHH